MALNFSSVCINSKPGLVFVRNEKNLFRFRHFLSSSSPPPPPPSSSVAAVSEGTEGSSSRTQLDLLEQLTTGSSSVDGYESYGSNDRLTIREQLVKLVGERDDDFTIPLGKNLKKFPPKLLTISQKRNIRRQAYLNEVSQRNDSVFFATIGAFVILPPLIILGIAIATGYVQLFP